MQRQVEDQLGPSFSRHVHPAASSTVKPESHDLPPLCPWGERQWSRSRGAPRSNLVAQPVGYSAVCLRMCCKISAPATISFISSVDPHLDVPKHGHIHIPFITRCIQTDLTCTKHVAGGGTQFLAVCVERDRLP